ncbi:E3 ubiquitin-protein ligase MSL2-like [Gadus chalcogrammus]|uniref:E3 ubiquitin-protein ligase MSL2-like n=1 Tax=Gadus chalcogrammus TaxID=1042646 RepID=UPI0024C3B121|nr:E3 ubiquitin-protein ligase MSL2-like [Gadus chalcogrammus]
MNPVNATALYLSASRAVFQCDPRRPQTFTEMYKLLLFFRQSLACLVCGKLLQDPIAPTHSECQHYVCSGCKGQKMQMKPLCSWCRDYSCFQENKQLSLLVQCYRKLCLYVTQSPLLQPISSQVGGCPELLALLEEVLFMTAEDSLDTEPDTEEPAPVDEAPCAIESLTPTEAPPVHAELSAPPQCSSSEPPWPGAQQDCNGTCVEELGPSSPELEVCELEEEQQQPSPGSLSAASSVSCGAPEPGHAPGSYAPPQTSACSLLDEESSRELEEGEVLLLSVEEVLQTLDPIQPIADSPESPPESTHTHTHTHVHIPSDRGHTTQMYIRLDTGHNYTQIQPDRTRTLAGYGSAARTHAPVAPSDPAPCHPPFRPNRKRSRSESDRERVKPLPIASILQGATAPPDSPSVPQPQPQPHPHPHPQPSMAPSHTYSSLPNGSAPKPNRPSPNYTKGARKTTVDPAPKKPCGKPRSSGGPKPKDQRTKDQRGKDQRLPSGCLVPAVKPPYKKPVEKKGCKCGRATQNPSVLTCRGQRCPCYSNRKACLDCICRGCQNSYMANGEKKLEAFAVPEKALEQTRLTLGINLTSITAAALRNPGTATAIHGSHTHLLNVATATGSPMATAYLAPSPPKDPAYKDGLELLIG